MVFGLFTHKPLCSFCGLRKMAREDESGAPICAICHLGTPSRPAMTLRPEQTEAKRCCPADGTEMKKAVLLDGNLIIDHCPHCGGMWLDKDEIDLIVEDILENGGDGLNQAAGMSFNALAVITSLNSVVNAGWRR